MLHFLKGNKGKWLAMEALPAYLLIFVIWPLTTVFQESTNWKEGFVQVYSSADCAAAAFCFLISASFDLARYVNNPENEKSERNWWVEGALSISLMLSGLIYFAVKCFPAGLNAAGEISGKAIFYCVLSWLITIGTSALVYHSKR